MEDRVVSYILGELSEQEQLQFESEFFANEEKFQLLQATRADLMDAYVDGKLSEKQRKQIEMHLLDSPGQRQYLEFAEVLTEYISTKELKNAPVAVALQKKDKSIWESITAFFRARNFALQ